MPIALSLVASLAYSTPCAVRGPGAHGMALMRRHMDVVAKVDRDSAEFSQQLFWSWTVISAGGLSIGFAQFPKVVGRLSIPFSIRAETGPRSSSDEPLLSPVLAALLLYPDGGPSKEATLAAIRDAPDLEGVVERSGLNVVTWDTFLDAFGDKPIDPLAIRCCFDAMGAGNPTVFAELGEERLEKWRTSEGRDFVGDFIRSRTTYFGAVAFLATLLSAVSKVIIDLGVKGFMSS